MKQFVGRYPFHSLVSRFEAWFASIGSEVGTPLQSPEKKRQALRWSQSFISAVLEHFLLQALLDRGPHGLFNAAHLLVCEKNMMFLKVVEKFE